MIIRMATEGDIPRMEELLYQVARVHHLGRPDLFKDNSKKYTARELREILLDPQRPVLAAADEEDRMQGYAFCIFETIKNDNVRVDKKTLYVDDICVDEKCRGEHIGTLIFKGVKEFAEKNGCDNITLNVWECNPGARSFYEAMGMEPYKTGMELRLR